MQDAAASPLTLARIMAGWLIPGAAVPWVDRLLTPPRRAPKPMGWPAGVQVAETEIPGPVPLRAWSLIPAGPVTRQVVLVHGWGAERSRMAALAGPLVQAGYACLLPDLRGHGESPGEGAYFVEHLLEDLDAVRAFLEADTGRGPAPALVGHSFGGLGALLSLASGRGWATAVALASPSSALRGLASYLRSLGYSPRLLPMLKPALRRVSRTDLARYDLCMYLPGATEPALAIHGTLDTVVSPGELERLRRCVPGSILECRTVAGEDHDSVLQSEGVHSMILRHLLAL